MNRDKFVEDPEAALQELGFYCQQCGHCCLGLGAELDLDKEETRKWRQFKELAPSNYGYHLPAAFISYFPETACADLWFHPETGEELNRCPFLKKISSQDKYQCLIYNFPELRPTAWQRFPLKEGKFMEEMVRVCPELRRLKQQATG